jgi:hypothetical protein
MSAQNFHVLLASKRSKNYTPPPNVPKKSKKRRQRKEPRESGLERALRIKLGQWNDDEYDAGKDW